MDHGTVRELAAGAALDDLEPVERLVLETHLASCPACRDEAREVAMAAGMLALAAPRRTPPDALRASVLAAVGASASSRSGDAAVVQLPPAPRRRSAVRRASFAALALAAALAVAVGALGATVSGLRSDLAAATSQRDAALARLAAGDAAMATALARGHATATLTPSPIAAGATVSVVYRPGTADAWLVGDGLPATPAGDVYQLWAADLAGIHPLTTFTCDGTSPCIASYGADLASARATMITLEPGGGSRGEPGPQVAFGKLQG
jgi:predicted anti-sigma-YlaC factor YlaD